SFSVPRCHRDVHSIPTRRSSDLTDELSSGGEAMLPLLSSTSSMFTGVVFAVTASTPQLPSPANSLQTKPPDRSPPKPPVPVTGAPALPPVPCEGPSSSLEEHDRGITKPTKSKDRRGKRRAMVYPLFC